MAKAYQSCSLKKKVEFEFGGGKAAELGKHFKILAETDPSGYAMEVGHEGSPSPIDQNMVDMGGLHHKQARNPLRPTNSPIQLPIGLASRGSSVLLVGAFLIGVLW